MLIRNDFLKIGGALILVADAGAGKSTISMQMAYAWALGRDAFGLKPARPLRIGIFQTEDDDDELRKLRDGIERGYKENLGWTDEDFANANKNLSLPIVKGLPVKEIFDKIRRLQSGDRKFDLIILNPLQAFTVGQDISSNSDLSSFLRKDLDSIIKDNEMKCGLFIIHHNTKPSREKGADFLYSGSGGNELTNWVRSKLDLRKESNDKYRLSAVKHGEDLPWPTMDKKTPSVTIHRAPRGSGIIFWSLDPSTRFIDGGNRSTVPPTPAKSDAEIVANELKANGETTLTEARQIARKAMSQKRGEKAFKEILENPAKYGLKITRTGQGTKQIITPHGEVRRFSRVVRKQGQKTGF